MSNVTRQYQNTTDPTKTLQDSQKKGQTPGVHKALVLDVILDPFNLSAEQKKSISDFTQKNKELTGFAEMMPANTIIGRIVSNEGGSQPSANIIILPWHSSHLMLPVKPGEVVNVVYDDLQNTGASMPFWQTRRHSPGTIEDVNYTHHDRIYDATHNPENFELADRAKTLVNQDGPGFPNGGGTPRSRSIDHDDADPTTDPYEQIKTQSTAYPLHVPEPVPRFKKKPGDLVLQGSNNTSVCLGEDRNGSISDPKNNKKFSGAIDMVAGRGRIMPIADLQTPIGTAPRVVTNSRGELETDKAPHRKGFGTRKDNPNEGNPDFATDAARVLVSMQTKADEEFGLVLNKAGVDAATSLNLPVLTGEGTMNRAHVVAKSDHARIIARNDPTNGIKGTVLIVREGLPNVDLGYLYINEAGEMQLEGEKLYFGEATGEAEPNLLFTNYKDTILALQNQIDTLTKLVETAMAGAAIPTPPAPGPIVSLSSVGIGKTITAANAADKATVSINTQPSQHSTKTFNEPNPTR